MPAQRIYAVFISIEATENNNTYVYFKCYETIVPDIAKFETNELYKSIYISEDPAEAFEPYLNIENITGGIVNGRTVNKIPTRTVATIECNRIGVGLDFNLICGNSSFPQNREEALDAYFNNNGRFIILYV